MGTRRVLKRTLLVESRKTGIIREHTFLIGMEFAETVTEAWRRMYGRRFTLTAIAETRLELEQQDFDRES